MKINDIRNQFNSYFKNHGHTSVPSSRLIPENDPTLLFTNAGMNQFKNVFLGFEKREYNRAVSVQKCVRAGGKHNDLENVGFTARHHTFFEMLGNFSFGDYFKREAIHFAWEFVTKEIGLDKNRLYVSVFKDDEEAATLWHKQEGVPKDRIFRFGEKDNFWRMGDTGPCGPCSEIFYDLGDKVPGDPKENVMGGNGDRFIEFWNLVFMQYQELGEGKRQTLPNPSIDTGAGLERLASILQGQLNNYHTDAFTPMIERAMALTKKEYRYDLHLLPEKEQQKWQADNVAFRVLADHSRATSLLIADGVMPSNEGRGYVLRRILRRAIRYGRELSQDQSLLPQLVQTVMEQMSPVYSELKLQSQLILQTVKDEESRFLATLDQGTRLLDDVVTKLKNKGEITLPGSALFQLYDTYGFPLDLTRLMAKEKGLEIDEVGFETLMTKAKEKAKASWKSKSISSDAGHLIEWTQSQGRKNGTTQFLGYDGTVSGEANLLGLSNGKRDVTELQSGEEGFLIFNKTPFYAESGGQVGDVGMVLAPQGQAEIFDCTKQNDIYIHHVRVVDGKLNQGNTCQLQVNATLRNQTANNHSATHLLHAALRKILGPQVTQAGSLVDSGRLRFDFTYSKPMTDLEIKSVETLVNREISANSNVETAEMNPADAVKAGALALFGEKYGDRVRVITMGDFSMELCGGTHVRSTSQIRFLKIVAESGVSAGVRRIEAITGDTAAEFLWKNTEENQRARDSAGITSSWTQYLDADGSQNPKVFDWIENQKNANKQLTKQLQNARSNQLDLNDLLKTAKPFVVGGKNGQLAIAKMDVEDREVLSQIADRVRDKIQSGVVIVLGEAEDSLPVVVSVSKNLNPGVSAGNILKSLAQAFGGKGGGRPDFAQGALPSAKTSEEMLSKMYAETFKLLV